MYVDEKEVKEIVGEEPKSLCVYVSYLHSVHKIEVTWYKPAIPAYFYMVIGYVMVIVVGRSCWFGGGRRTPLDPSPYL